MNKIIPIWKERGISSYDVIRKIKKNISGVKIGHCGTLDPFAEGMMLICTGIKTKKVQELMTYDKVYEAKIYIGKETDTLDATGEIIKEGNTLNLSIKNIKRALDSFKGTVMQSPPYFSAVKLNGIRLYKFARKDIYIKKKPREVYVHNIELLELNENIIDVRISVGKGFYIRAFAKDFAKKLGTFGYLLELKRISIGPFDESTIVNIEDLKCPN